MPFAVGRFICKETCAYFFIWKNSRTRSEISRIKSLEMNEEGNIEVRREEAMLKLDTLSTIGAIEDSRESGSLAESTAPAEGGDRRRN